MLKNNESEKILLRENKNKRLIIFTLLILAIASFLISNCIGSVNISVKDIVFSILGKSTSANEQIIKNIRLPRAILSVLVGTNLALSGCILQGIMHNPLADPHIIGVSSGAGLLGIIILIIFPEKIDLLPIVAFIGAMGAAMLIYALAWKRGINTVRIILAGVAVSTLLGAGISAIMVFYSDKVHGALMFMNGGLSGRSWPYVKIILPYTIFGLICCMLFSEKLNILTLGDDVARSLGLNVELSRIGFTALAAILAASAVSVAGLLGFVGLIVPHICRMILGSNHKYLFPSTAFLGAIILSLSDTVARVVFSPKEIPVGVIMALLGAPFFLYLLRKEI